MRTKVLLITDEGELTRVAKGYLKGKNAQLYVAGDVTGANRIISTKRPTVIINTVLDEEASSDIRAAAGSGSSRTGSGYSFYDAWSMPFGKTSIFVGPMLEILRGLSISNSQSADDSSFEVRDGKVSIRREARSPTEVSKAAEHARHALLEAKEAFSGVASHDSDLSSLGNRVVVPLSSEVIQTIESTLDAAVALSYVPARGHPATSSLKGIISSLQGAEKIIKQVEKTATVALKLPEC